MIRRPPRSTPKPSSAASDVYKRQIKGTGNGHRDAGSSMIDNCTENKSCMVDFSGKVQKAQIDNT